MQRYFLNSKCNYLSKEDSFHAVKVMRSNVDDKIITCFNGECYLSKITIIDQNKTEFHNIEKQPKKEILDITLVQGLPKGSKTDEICKTATTFGVNKIIFISMVRSIAKLKNEQVKMARYNKIIKEASELSHRNSLPKLAFLNSVKALDFTGYDYILLCDEQEAKEKVNLKYIDKTKKICIIIGPEGGIDPKERNYFIEKNAKLISLGNYILPTELAHLFVLPIIYALD